MELRSTSSEIFRVLRHRHMTLRLSLYGLLVRLAQPATATAGTAWRGTLHIGEMRSRSRAKRIGAPCSSLRTMQRTPGRSDAIGSATLPSSLGTSRCAELSPPPRGFELTEMRMMASSRCEATITALARRHRGESPLPSAAGDDHTPPLVTVRTEPEMPAKAPPQASRVTLGSHSAAAGTQRAGRCHQQKW